nr:hypothetical protein [Tanacetum cinerariifolium]
MYYMDSRLMLDLGGCSSLLKFVFKDTRSSRDYLEDLEEEYQERALLAMSKRFFKKGNNEAIEVKALMALANEERVSVGKESASNGKWVKISIQKAKYLVFVKSSADNSNMSITSGNKPSLSKAKDFTLPNHDIGKVPPDELQRNTIDPSVAVTDSSTTDYDSADESSVCSTPLPLLEKLADAKLVFRPKAIKLILKSNSTFKAKTLKNITLKEPSSAPAKDNR